MSPAAAITSAQQARLGAGMRTVGITTRAAALAFVTEVIGRQVSSRNELTKIEAAKVIDALAAREAASAPPPEPDAPAAVEPAVVTAPGHAEPAPAAVVDHLEDAGGDQAKAPVVEAPPIDIHVPEPSTAFSQLVAALARFQAEAPVVPKTKTARTPQYTYSYADLADCMRAAAPVLARHGLAFACEPTVADPTSGRLVLVGRLLHVGGGELRGTLPLVGATAQQIGSSLTYGRRYLLGALTGLVTEEDDDGAAASRGATP